MSEHEGPNIHIMDSNEDFYDILGIETDAAPEQVRLAYRDLVRQYHPDAGLVTGTSLLFRQIQRAYETLRDPERRRSYDEWLRRRGKYTQRLFDLEVIPGPSHLVATDASQRLSLLIKITPESGGPAARAPLNLCLVLDRSTSMKGSRLSAVREATMSVVDRLEPEDVFSLVTFSDRAEVLVPAQHKPDKAVMRSLLGGLRASGGTEAYQGLVAGMAEVTRVRSSTRINHVILLTDGHTYGDDDKCLLAAKTAASHNIGISAIGVGNDWNEDFLDQLTAPGGGTVIYAEQTANVGEAFARELRKLKEVWIPDLRLQLHYDPIACNGELFSLSPELMRLITDEENSAVLGPLHHRDPRLFLLELNVSPQPKGIHRVLRLELRGNLPPSGAPAMHRTPIRVDFRPPTFEAPAIPPEVSEAQERVSLLRIQEQAYLEAQQGKTRQAAQRLEMLAKKLLREGRRELAYTVQEEAGRLARTGSFTKAGTKRMRYGTRSLA